MANRTAPRTRYEARPVAVHSMITKMPKNRSEDPRSFSRNSTARERPHATSSGPRYRGSGNRRGPSRRVATANSSLRAERYDARKITMRTLPISAGWKLSGPIRTHSRAPLMVRPIPGATGSSSRRMPTSPIV
jgi:hypothetical protein